MPLHDHGTAQDLLVLHILAAIVGFGSVMLNGVYASEVKRRPGPEGAAIADANYKVSFGIAMWFNYAIPILGLALVGMSDKAWKFSQTWVWLALLLWFVLVGLVHGVHRPNVRQLDALVRSGTQTSLSSSGGAPSGHDGHGPQPSRRRRARPDGVQARSAGQLIRRYGADRCTPSSA